MKHIYIWTYIFFFIHLLCAAPSFALDGCREHFIVTDPASLTATVNLDPYHRYVGEIGTDLTHEENNSVVFTCMEREQIFYHVPEGKYIYRNSIGQCRVVVAIELRIVAVDDAVTLELPCNSTSFSPYFFDILDNDYLVSYNAEHSAEIVDSLVAIHLVEAPSFVSVTKGGLLVDMPSDGAEGVYDVKYYLQNNIGVISDTAVATIRFHKYCPEEVKNDPLPETRLEAAEYFSPNGDGINDVWEIASLDTMGSYKLNIFDRYGKLIRSYLNDYVPWDGTSGGNRLPSDDYWFYIFFFDLDRSFVGHVTLVR